MPKKLNPAEIDAVLPQTQCGLCSYKGCEPYAVAIVMQNEKIDRCLPGGISVLKKLATLTEQDATPYIEEMAEKAKPTQVVVVREEECIGCTKCIQACPVDAIIGSAKQMHTVITDACTGCELCIPPCPTDCIDIITLPTPTEEAQQLRANQARQRFYTRQRRLSAITNEPSLIQENKDNLINERKAAIQAAVERAKAKKQTLS